MFFDVFKIHRKLLVEGLDIHCGNDALYFFSKFKVLEVEN